MAHTFKLNKESLKREFSVYVVISHSKEKAKLYVGKTGDNRAGCNPIISRCGNHFSYNKIHSQVRNKITNHEKYEYTYVFDHFGEYLEAESDDERKKKIDEINEMERCLNKKIQEITTEKIVLLNPLKRDCDNTFDTPKNKQKIINIVKKVEELIGG
ncbi:hypothetical protein SPONN_1854 [uncultured Candidatus Thioglobus sp.]|nr:hypothetical protein SPONN_1854 [uncultured Candidatus Thioglobus sp.]